MAKTSRARYTLEFKQEAVRLVDNGQASQRRRARWAWLTRRCSTGLKAHRQGKLT